MSVFRRLTPWTGALILVVVAGLMWRGQQEAPTPASTNLSAQPALSGLTLLDLEGHPQSLRQWQGRVLVLNFWATWCGPCRDEMPMLSQLQRELGDHSVRFVGIAMDSADAVRGFLERQPVSYPTLLGQDDTLSLTRAYGNVQGGIPMTLVFDPQGNAVLAQVGRVTQASLRQAIQAATPLASLSH